MNSLKFSVIIPVYNGKKFLEAAILSVLDQDFYPLEIIVVDDGSTDNTVEVIKKFGNKIRYYYQDHGGVASARNRGVALAKGEFISFIDADDLWFADKLKSQFNLFHENSDLGVVIGLLKKFQYSENDELNSSFESKNTKGEFALSLGCSLIRASVFEKAGNFDESMKFGEDIDWFLRVIEGGVKISVLNESIYLYRIHDNNMTHDVKNTNLYLLKAYKKSLDRRRILNPENPLPLPDIRNPESLKSFFETE